MNAASYDFDERLRISQGFSEVICVESILLGNIPGAVKVFKAHESNDRAGTDWWVEHTRGEFMSVDQKVREKDCTQFGNDDLALETWSVVESRIPGWTRTSNKRTDYILWTWMDTGRWCLLPFPMICKVFEGKWKQWRKSYRTAVQKTPVSNGRPGYHSECVFVPRKLVWEEIYTKFSGSPSANDGA